MSKGAREPDVPRTPSGRKRRLKPPGTRKKPGRRPSNKLRKNGKAAPGPLTPRGTTGRPSHREAVETSTIIRRRERVMDLVGLKHLTFAQAAEALTAEGLPCTSTTVWKDFQVCLAEVKTRTRMTSEQAVALELERIESYDRAILTWLYSDDAKAALRAHQRLTAGSERRSRLQGLERPVEGMIPLDQVARAFGTFVQVLLGEFQEPEHRKKILEAVRRQRAIDVTPTITDGRKTEDDDAA